MSRLFHQRKMPTPRPGFRTPAANLVNARGVRIVKRSGPSLGIYAGNDYAGPPIDPNVQRRIALLGGVNLYGEPRFRLVWGWARRTWIGGRYPDGFVGYRLEPKYWPKFERWHLEQWKSAEEIGSPEWWEYETTSNVDGITIRELGPYPARGEYEQVRCIEDDRKQFFPLVPAAVDQIVRLVDWARGANHAEKKAGIEAAQARKDASFDSMADDVVMDASLPFHGQAFVSQVPGIPASDGKGIGS